MAQVQVYTTPFCPYCMLAKRLLKAKGVQFEEINVGRNPELRARMVELAGGRYTVPEVFINGEIIGGYEELRALEASGMLDRILMEQA